MLSQVIRWLKKNMCYNIYRELSKKPYLMTVGDGTVILDSTYVRQNVPVEKCRIFIGENSMIGCNFIFESDGGSISVGSKTYIGAGTHLISRSSISIGDDVTIAWGVWIYDHDSHSLDWRNRADDIQSVLEDYRAGRNIIASKDWSCVNSEPIKICDKAWIGMNVILLKGITVGEGAVVGAGSVVAGDIPPWTVAVGNPARVVKEIPHEGE
ncbi:acyltransferase [Selenomonas sp. TAMA-11512]|uniref:acyltransferase n=1 Tax=Selenomonas sp. TAMA-11512 TaxID=3095337 RepID=UPI00309237F6|nr:acyltransferase [Selenomonas sp. TAMA-11512]